MKRLALATTALVFAACASSATRPVVMCASDDECGAGQLCFAEGCGDPGKGIVVEVEGGALNGQFARDFPVDSTTLTSTLAFDLGPPLAFSGEFQRERSAVANPLDRTFYTDAVVVRAVGQSDLLPGINRTFEARFDTTERGSFEMKVGAGTYVVTAMPGERTVPPVASTVSVGNPDAGTSGAVTFVFPSVDGAPALTGQLIKKMDVSTLPPEPVLLSTPYTILGTAVPTVDLQLFDVENNPLSQRFPMGSTTGEFAITISPEARTKPRLILVAMPREPGVAIPTKRFVLDAAQLTRAVTLEYGDFGEEAEVKGTILDSTGAPVAGAQVVLQGTVVGDGSFRSKIVETGADGKFKVVSLPSKGDGTFQLTVVPPKGSRAAASQRLVTVTVSRPAGAGSVVGKLSPETFTIDDRIVARGVVYRPGGSKPAAGVFVRATRQNETTGSADDTTMLPIEPAEATTAEDGTFELRLDPGLWRFEYTPGEALPLSSRLVTINPGVDAMTGQKLPAQDLNPVELSYARTVSGTVTGAMGLLTRQPVPYSQLRFFRVTTVEGRPASILLGTTIADDRGRFKVVLPSVAPSSTK